MNLLVVLTQSHYYKKMPGEAVKALCRWSEVKGLEPTAECKCSLELGGTRSSQREKNISQLIAKR